MGNNGLGGRGKEGGGEGGELPVWFQPVGTAACGVGMDHQVVSANQLLES